MYYTSSIHRTAPVYAKTGLFSRLMQARAIAKERRALAKLTDARLHDIGLTRTQANQEVNRSGWDAPSHWRR